jgi:ABC-type transport system substrate-binding protein
MHLRKVWVLMAEVPAARALTATGSAGKAITLVFGAEQGGGPDWCLNLILDVDCGTFWNVVFQTPVIRGAFLSTPDFTYKPDLISRYTLKLRPMRVTYYIRKNARWSDGVPVTSPSPKDRSNGGRTPAPPS